MSTRFLESGALTLDTNDNTDKTVRITLPEGATHTTVFVVGSTGTHATHQVVLQGSPNGTNWFDLATAITGIDVLENHVCTCPILRVKCSVAEGATSTCDIYVISS